MSQWTAKAATGAESDLLKRNGWGLCDSPSDGEAVCDLTGAYIPKGEQVWWRTDGGEDWREGTYASRREAFADGRRYQHFGVFDDPRSRWFRQLYRGRWTH